MQILIKSLFLAFKLNKTKKVCNFKLSRTKKLNLVPWISWLLNRGMSCQVEEKHRSPIICPLSLTSLIPIFKRGLKAFLRARKSLTQGYLATNIVDRSKKKEMYFSMSLIDLKIPTKHKTAPVLLFSSPFSVATVFGKYVASCSLPLKSLDSKDVPF